MKTINRTSFKEVKGYENILNSNVINVIENLHDKFYERIINLRKDRLKVLNYVLSNNESNPVKILKKNLLILRPSLINLSIFSTHT